MERTRHLSRYQTAAYTYVNFEEFLARALNPGIHSFREAGSVVDILYDERQGQNSLLVYFSSSANPEVTYPFFAARNVAKAVGASMLAFSDPGIAKSARIGTNYFLGSASFDLPAVIDRAVQKVADGRRLIFFGTSAGGFAALRHGMRNPDSLTFVTNPVTNLFSRAAFVDKGKEIFFPGMTFKEVSEIRELRIKEVPNHVLYTQNLGDHRYYAEHMVPFFEHNIQNPNVSIYWGNWGKGHVGMPSEEMSSTMGKLLKGGDWKKGINEVGVKYRRSIELQVARSEKLIETLAAE